jgi:uncharacterized repeat protein (TIGR03803 family)
MVDKTFLMKRNAMLVFLVFGVLLGAVRAQNESVLYSFCAQADCTDGAFPYAGLVFDQKGNLYGTTTGGDNACYPDGCGVIFKLTPKGEETVLYSFCAQINCTDGANPSAGLIFDQKGNIYGTTRYGGGRGNGVVFKLTPEGKETVLYSFCARNGCTDGGVPWAGLVFDQKGNLYGTTTRGGAFNNATCQGYGCGVVFKLTPGGKYTALHSFCGPSNCANGAFPIAGLVLDQTGNLYGTTYFGGANNDSGVVFKLSPKGKEKVLYSFCAQSGCTDGAEPVAGLVFDQKGNLYGTTWVGGVHSYGTVFELTPKGKETVLHSFCVGSYCPDGSFPDGGVVFDQKGNLYGTTSEGGGLSGYCIIGCGVVFKLTPKGKETVLHNFCQDGYPCADGETPTAGLVFDQKGNLYGTTSYGGAYGNGVVFKLTP